MQKTYQQLLERLLLLVSRTVATIAPARRECQTKMKTNCSQNRELNQISSATYNVQQLAQFLNISRDTIYRMRDSGELPPTIPMQRRIVRWQVKDIELWFEFGCPTEKSFVRLKKDMLRFTRQN